MTWDTLNTSDGMPRSFDGSLKGRIRVPFKASSFSGNFLDVQQSFRVALSTSQVRGLCRAKQAGLVDVPHVMPGGRCVMHHITLLPAGSPEVCTVDGTLDGPLRSRGCLTVPTYAAKTALAVSALLW